MSLSLCLPVLTARTKHHRRGDLCYSKWHLTALGAPSPGQGVGRAGHFCGSLVCRCQASHGCPFMSVCVLISEDQSKALSNGETPLLGNWPGNRPWSLSPFLSPSLPASPCHACSEGGQGKYKTQATPRGGCQQSW